MVVPRTATTMAAYSLAETPWGKYAQGVSASRPTCFQGTYTERMTATYENSAMVSHFRMRTVRSYEK
jgi:hypothetical protein